MFQPGQIICASLACTIALGFLVPVAFGGSQSRGPLCVTAEGERGRCVLVKQCPSILSTLRKHAHTNEDSRHVYGSECGRAPDGRALVCCLLGSSQPDRGNVSTAGESSDVRLNVAESVSSEPVCGVQPSAKQIDTENASQNVGFHPWNVLLHNGNQPYETKFPCTGTLISARHILTSAGCVDGEEKRVNLTARLGEYDLESAVDCLVPTGDEDIFCAKPSYDVGVSAVLMHEGSAEQRNDIALLQLSQPVELNEWVFPVCLPESLVIDETATYQTASWNQNTCEETTNRHKLLANHSVTNRTACWRHLSSDSAASFLCVSSAGQAFADGGGALTFESTVATDRGPRTVHKLVGILSSSSTCANYDGALIYTKVGPHLEWIQRHMG